jgi:3-hydroxyacyl-[acyl-carrier-protein] dehydratase
MKEMGTPEINASVTTEGNSPWFSGHFPGDPILPGIAQLKMVVDLIRKQKNGDCCISGLSRVKFRKIIRPGDQLDIQVLDNDKENQYLFKITCGNEDVCSGKILLTQKQIITNS